MKKDLRKEQVFLRRLEKKALEIADILGDAKRTAANADKALGGAATSHLDEINATYLAFMEKVSEAHADLEKTANARGFRIIGVDGGFPKPRVMDTAKSRMAT